MPGSDGIGDTSYIFDYTRDRYPLMFLAPPLHDVAVIDITCSKTVVGQGYSLNITVTVANPGTFAETLNLTVRMNTTVIQTWNETLPRGNSAALTFAWNTSGLGKGNHTIILSAYVWPVAEETNTTNNEFVTNSRVFVALVGDITGGTANAYDFVPDGKVDIKDLALIAKYYGQNVPPASPNCDLTGPTTGVQDGKIDIRDLAAAAKDYGKIDP